MTPSAPLPSQSHTHFIGSCRGDHADERRQTLHSPVDGAPLGSIPLASPETVDRAVRAASDAAPAWAALPLRERAEVLYRFRSLVAADMHGLADSIARESGKLTGEAVAEVERGLEVVEFAASLPNLGLEPCQEVSRGVYCQVVRSPLGVVAGVTPFNFPAMVPMWMFPIALGCGNAFVLKPSEHTSISALRLANLLSEAGLPEGVFNVVLGDRTAVEALIDHPGIAAVGFVGSTAAAHAVYARAAARGKRALALGGAKNHIIVLPDADPEIAAPNIVASAMGCAGQRCMAASVLILVGDCEPLLSRVVATSAALKFGKSIGAVINPAAQTRIFDHIRGAEARGARLLLDGRTAVSTQGGVGCHVGPTVIEGLPPGDPAACDEIFGPVLTVLRVKTLDEALAIERASPYGNASLIYTNDGAAAERFAALATVGMVGINVGVPVPREPFSFGGWNQSRFGAGDITGNDGVRFWTQTKKITRKWSAQAARNWMS